jgi:hypothetical protein
MKRFLLLLAVLFACITPARAVDMITATVTVTATPSNGNTLTVNGSARTWKTSVVTASTDILISSGIGPTATNLYNQVAAYGFSGPLTLARSSTNAITLRGIPGQSMTLSSSGSWATITYVTNTVTDSYVFRVPFTSETAATQTNIASLALTSIRDYATNSFTLTTAMQNFADTKTSQTLSNKTLSTGTYMKAGTITNTAAEQITFKYRSSADIGASGYNGLYFTKNAGGDPWIIAPDSAGKPSLYNANNTNPPVTAADFTPNPQNILNLLVASNTFGGKSYANSWTGTNEFSRITNSTIVGSTISQSSSIDGYVSAITNGYWMSGGITNGTLTNTTVYGTHSMVGSQAYTRASHTSLASGNNSAVNFGTGTYVVISSGPSAAFALAGIANGANGRVYIIHNATAYAMSILNDSGVDPTAANRIYTNTGADLTFSGASTVTLIYDSTLSRWVVVATSDVDLASQANGNLPVSRLNSGTDASSGTVWYGDGVWRAVPTTIQYGTNFYVFNSNQFTTDNDTNIMVKSGARLTNTVLYGSTSGTWTVGSAGSLTADTARTISTTTGALTLLTGGGNGDIILSPNGTGKIQIKTATGAAGPRKIITDETATSATNSISIYPDDGSITYGSGISVYSYTHGARPGYLWLGYGGSGKIQLGLGSDSTTGTARVEINGTDLYSLVGLKVDGDAKFAKTITGVGTTGTQTINKTTGRINLAAGDTSKLVNNSLCTANSIIIATVASNDATMNSVKVVAGSGSFTIYPNAAPTAETAVNWILTN